MMRSSGFVFLALVSCPAMSVSATDNRIRTLRYDQNEIVKIPGKASIQSTIEFGLDERIESVAVGNSAAWQVTPNHRASLLFVKPLVATSRTNMTVVTDKRTYMFDLVTGRYEAAPIYSLRFTYPEDPADKAKTELARAAPLQPAASTPPTPVELNFGWKTKGAAELLPARVFDDGESLYLSWDRNGPLPAVLTLAEDGQQAALNYRVSGDYIVVTPVPANVSLRYGKRTSTAVRIATIKGTRPSITVATREAAGPPVPLTAPVKAGKATGERPQTEFLDPKVAATVPAAHGAAGLVQRLAYPRDDDERLSDNHHE